MSDLIEQLQYSLGEGPGVDAHNQIDVLQSDRVIADAKVQQALAPFGVKLDRERVRVRLDEIASSYPNSDEVRRTYLQSAEAMRQIEASVLEDQVIDWVLERASVTELPTTFSALTGFAQTNETQHE